MKKSGDTWTSNGEYQTEPNGAKQKQSEKEEGLTDETTNECEGSYPKRRCKNQKQSQNPLLNHVDSAEAVDKVD